MLEPYKFSPPPSPEDLRGPHDEVHEYVTKELRDVTQGGPVIRERAGSGIDTGLRDLSGDLRHRGRTP